MVLDGCGQITGENLAAIVIEGGSGTLVRITGHVEYIPADDAQRMGQHCNHVAVLLNILGQRIAHQAPALDIAHTGNVRKKIIAHFISPSMAESRLFYHSKGTISTNKYCNVE